MTDEHSAIATSTEPASSDAAGLAQLRELVDAAGIATIFTTITGEYVDANDPGAELFRSQAVPGGRLDGRESLRTVLEA